MCTCMHSPPSACRVLWWPLQRHEHAEVHHAGVRGLGGRWAPGPEVSGRSTGASRPRDGRNQHTVRGAPLEGRAGCRAGGSGGASTLRLITLTRAARSPARCTDARRAWLMMTPLNACPRDTAGVCHIALGSSYLAG